MGTQGLETMGGGAVGLKLLEGFAEFGQESVPLIAGQQGVDLGERLMAHEAGMDCCVQLVGESLGSTWTRVAWPP